MTDWSDATFFGQKHGCTVITTMRSEVGWISRYFFHSLITTNARFMKDISEWALSLPASRSIRDMLVTQEMWRNFRSNLVEDVLAASPRASNRDRARRARKAEAPATGTAVSKRVALFMSTEAARSAAEAHVPHALQLELDAQVGRSVETECAGSGVWVRRDLETRRASEV
jgi:hypothetical protein